MKVGIEIECVYNAKSLSLEKGPYHGGVRFNDDFRIESDGSLYGSRLFPLEDTCEFVSKVFNSKKELVEAIRGLRTDLNKGRKKKRALNKLMYFNKSCGAHIHFSFPDYNFWKKASPQIFEKARTRFMKLLDENKKISKKTKDQVKENYDRSYAIVRTTIRQRHLRSAEWNFQSEQDDKGMEWRSFNVTGAKSWVELVNLYRIAWDTLIGMKNDCKKWTEKEMTEIEHKVKKPRRKYRRVNMNLKMGDEAEDYIIVHGVHHPNEEVEINVQH